MKTNISSCLLAIGLALLCGNNRGYAVGAVTSFTSVEAEAATRGGGATLVSLTAPPTDQYSSPELEASGHAYVRLNATGQYVEWVNTTGQSITALNLRSSIPDAAGGGGITSTINLYVNGVFRQALSVTSQQNYNYEGTNYNGQEDKNPADGRPRNFWNDTHAFITGAAIAAGSTIRLQKDSANSASFYYIDVLDLEVPPAALGQPANSLSITSYGAQANNINFDNTSALNNCFTDAKAQGKVAWIPSGTFYFNASSGGLHATGITIAGAGVWYSTLYRVTTSGGVANMITAFSCTLSNVAFDCNSSSRAGNNNNGAVNFSGTNWLVDKVWIQHVTSAFWCGGLNGTVRNSRMLSIWSDGGNFNNFDAQGGKGINLTYSNNFIRGSGDDAMAINASDDNGHMPMSNIKYVSNTSISAYGGKGIAVYGGSNLTITNNLIMDSPRYAGVAIGFFSQTAAITNALVQGNVLLRCGGNEYNLHSPALELGTDETTVPDKGINFIGNTITDPIFGGVTVKNCTSLNFQNNTITHPSLDGITVKSSAVGNGTFTGNTVNNLNAGKSAFINNAPGTFTATLIGNSWQTTGVTFYQDSSYGGTSGQSLTAGTYTTAQLGTKGVPDNWASSVRIPSGWTVIMYSADNFTGTSWTLTSDTPSFSALSPSANDQLSSCNISSGGSTLLSQGHPTTASTDDGVNVPGNGNDGNTTTTRWAAVDGTYPQWWRVDLGASHTLNTVTINWFSSGSRAYKYKIETSANDSSYTTVVDKTGNTTNGDTTDSFTGTGRYVRITVTGSSAGYASFYECKVLGN